MKKLAIIITFILSFSVAFAYADKYDDKIAKIEERVEYCGSELVTRSTEIQQMLDRDKGTPLFKKWEKLDREFNRINREVQWYLKNDMPFMAGILYTRLEEVKSEIDTVFEALKEWKQDKSFD